LINKKSIIKKNSTMLKSLVNLICRVDRNLF
jgi:hypothetical protein